MLDVDIEQEKMQANQARRASLNFTELLFLDNKRDPYNSDLTVPLLEFIQHPSVASTIHNGAAFQVRILLPAPRGCVGMSCDLLNDDIIYGITFQRRRK